MGRQLAQTDARNTKEQDIQIVPNTTHFNEKVLAKVDETNKVIKEQLRTEYNFNFDKVTLVANEIIVPDDTHPPATISDEGKKLWKRFCRKHSDAWEKYDDPEYQWRVAVAIWRRYAAKRSCPPFKQGDIDTSTIKDFQKRLDSGIKKMVKDTNLVTKLLVPKFASRVLVLSLSEITETTPGKWLIVFSQKINKCQSFSNKKLNELLRKHSFTRYAGVYTRDVNTNIQIKLVEEDDATYMKSQITLTDQILQLGIGISNEDMQDKEKAKKLIAKFFKDNVKEARKS